MNQLIQHLFEKYGLPVVQSAIYASKVCDARSWLTEMGWWLAGVALASRLLIEFVEMRKPAWWHGTKKDLIRLHRAAWVISLVVWIGLIVWHELRVGAFDDWMDNHPKFACTILKRAESLSCYESRACAQEVDSQAELEAFARQYPYDWRELLGLGGTLVLAHFFFVVVGHALIRVFEYLRANDVAEP